MTITCEVVVDSQMSLPQSFGLLQTEAHIARMKVSWNARNPDEKIAEAK